MSDAAAAADAAEPGAPLIFLIAGEPSGDQLGGLLMTALRDATGDQARFVGIGGERMMAQGLQRLMPMEAIGFMGLLEVLPHLRAIARRLREIAEAVRTLRPAVVVTIDVPSFSFRIAERLLGSGIPIVHYVAPSVWAWRPKRAADAARRLDHLLAILPFEPPYFERHGLPCTYVGHPVMEAAEAVADPQHYRRSRGIDPDQSLLALLPGSRRGELARLWPPFAETLRLLAAAHPNLRVVVPTLPALLPMIESAVGRLPLRCDIVTDPAERRGAMAAATVALAASGTVTLELAQAGVPAVLAYKVNPVTAALVRRLLRVRFAGLVNLLIDREVQPEFLHEKCNPQLLAPAVDRLLRDPAAREVQRAGYREALARLAVDRPPSRRAAEVVLEVARSGVRPERKGRR